MLAELAPTVLSADRVKIRRYGEPPVETMVQRRDVPLMESESELKLLTMEAVIALWKWTRKMERYLG
jgi:hypothetical protein